MKQEKFQFQFFNISGGTSTSLLESHSCCVILDAPAKLLMSGWEESCADSVFDWCYRAAAHSQLILTLFDKTDRVVVLVGGVFGLFIVLTLTTGSQIGSRAGTTARPRAERRAWSRRESLHC